MASLLPNDIIKDKIFIINRSDIEGRLDPKMALYNRKVQHSLYPLVTLGSLLQSKPQYGANEVGIPRVSHEEIKYIRITDIDEFGQVDSKGLGATVNNVEQKYILNENDILLARSGATVGKAYIHKQLPYKCLFAGYLIRFVIDANKAIPDYIFTYTQLSAYKEWVNAIQRPTGQPNINAEEYKSLEIPLPEIPIQRHIVNKINLAYQQKANKYAEAQQLLDSIDAYVLYELGITLPEIQSDLSNRMFYSSFQHVVGQRLDPVNILYLGQKTQSAIYDNIPLKDIATLVKGQTITESNAISGDFPVIAGGKTSPYTHNTYNQKGNVITVSASGAYSGYVWYHTNSIYASDCTVIRSKSEDRFLTQYIFEVLKAQQSRIYLLQQGAGQPHVYPIDLAQLWIPIIDMPKQQEIIEHINDIRRQAKALQAEGRVILEQAKQEVEKMIIG